MMWEPEIRLARREEVRAVDDLRAAARVGLAEQRGGGRWCAENPLTDSLPDVEHERVLVACLDDVPLGYLLLDLREEPASAGAAAGSGRITVARIREVFVDAAAREIGCGDGLMAAACDWARTRGCSLLEGTALPGDRATKNLFERAGITARLITVSIEL